MSVVIAFPSRSARVSRPKEPGLPWPALWLRRLRDRRALAMLDAEQIRDAGLDPLALREEMLKPFWRA